jgi:hypothetical protein
MKKTMKQFAAKQMSRAEMTQIQGGKTHCSFSDAKGNLIEEVDCDGGFGECLNGAANRCKDNGCASYGCGAYV